MRVKAHMAKVTITIPAVSWRDGRPRYNPGPETRRRFGVKGQDLRHPDGTWYSAEEARAWVQQHREDLAKAAGEKRPKAAMARARAAGLGPSIGSLAEDYFKSPVVTGGAAGKRRQKGKSANTIKFYRQKLAQIERFNGDIYHGPAAALTKPICKALYEQLWEKHGLATARACLAALSVVLSWAIGNGKLKLPVNPALGLGMTTPEPRQRAGTPAEIRQLVAAADLAVYPGKGKDSHKLFALPEVGDMTILGVWTGQRQADRLRLTEAELAGGRLVDQQNKTDARVDFPQGPELVARLAAIKARQKLWKVVPAASAPIIHHSARQAPFKHGTDYAHIFARVRAVAVAGIWRDIDGGLHVASNDAGKISEADVERFNTFAGWALRPMASLADFTDQDLRDTCVTWLARAECDPIRIAAVTGHSLASVHRILKHYLVSHPDYGDQAIAKLVAWLDKQTG